MKTRSSSNYIIINYNVYSLKQPISILYIFVALSAFKLMTGVCSKIMHLLKGEPRGLSTDLYLIYKCTLYINFYYIYKKI